MSARRSSISWRQRLYVFERPDLGAHIVRVAVCASPDCGGPFAPAPVFPDAATMRDQPHDG